MKRCRHTDGHRHNCGYVEQINTLIPGAVERANRRFLREAGAFLPLTGAERDQWDRFFHAEMRIAAESLGIVRTVRH